MFFSKMIQRNRSRCEIIKYQRIIYGINKYNKQKDSSSLDQIIADKTATATAKDRKKARIRKKFTTLYNSHEKKMQNDVQKLFHYAVQRRMQKNTEKGFEPDFANNVS